MAVEIEKAVPNKDTEERQKTKAQVPANQDNRFFGVSGKNHEPEAPTGDDIDIWRRMRLDPTLALARAIANAPIRSAEWAVEDDDDAPEGAKDMLEAMLKHTWRGFIRNATYARDYGWQSFELIFGIKDKYSVVSRFKPLVPEITQVVVDKHGNYLGLRNGKRHEDTRFKFGIEEKDKKSVFLPALKSFWFSNEKEGDNYYGESFMDRAHSDWIASIKIKKKGDRYATTVSGPIPYVRFPDSESQSSTGAKESSALFAEQLLHSLSSAIGIAIPGIKSQWIELALENGIDPSKLDWEIGFVEHNTKSGDEFLAFERARDVGKLRAWLVPERAATEGQHGTKAEAETHADLVMTVADLFLDDLVEAFNRHIVSLLMRINFGEGTEDTIRVKIQRTDPVKAQLLREIIKGLYGASVNLDVFEERANVEAAFDMLGIPMRDDIEERVEDSVNEEPEDETDKEEEPAPEQEEEPEEEELSREPSEGEVREADGDYYQRLDGKWTPVTIEPIKPDEETDQVPTGTTT